MVNITLYKNKAERHRVNKTDYLTEVASVTGTFTEDVSVTSPTLLLKYNSVPDFNYIFVAEFHRYYFVTDYTHTANNLWAINLEIDVLMSYKNGIYNLRAFVDRCENHRDDMIIDNKRTVQQGYDVEEYTVENDVFSDINLSSNSFVVTGFALKQYGDVIYDFTIDGVTYMCSAGMTWGEWVSSEYNSGGFTIKLNSAPVDSQDRYIYLNEVVTAQQELVNDVIVDNGVYVTE